MGTPLFYEYTAHYDRGSVDGKAFPRALQHSGGLRHEGYLIVGVLIIRGSYYLGVYVS